MESPPDRNYNSFLSRCLILFQPIKKGKDQFEVNNSLGVHRIPSAMYSWKLHRNNIEFTYLMP